MVDGKPTWPEQPGDYVGPVSGFTGEALAVFFLKPNARDEGVLPRARSVQHVCSPPHTFRECPDGSLEIRASLSNLLLEANAHPQASRDVDTLMAEAGYWRGEHRQIQLALGAVTERLGRLQRGDKPNSDTRRS